MLICYIVVIYSCQLKESYELLFTAWTLFPLRIMRVHIQWATKTGIPARTATRVDSDNDQWVGLPYDQELHDK